MMEIRFEVDLDNKKLISALLQILFGILEDEDIDEDIRYYYLKMVIALTNVSEILIRRL